MTRNAYLTTEDFWKDRRVHHLKREGTEETWRSLIRDIEEKGWLAGQAESQGSFGAPSRELETGVLPHLVERGDWVRFVRHAATAAQLRGMAQALEEGPVLRSLAEANRIELAKNLAARLPNPLQRARARAEIGAALPEDRIGWVREEVRQDLTSAELTDSAQDAERLAKIVRLLAPNMPQELEVFAKRFARVAPEKVDLVWRALAESLLAYGKPDAKELWGALRSIRAPKYLPPLQPPEPDMCRPWLCKIDAEMGEVSQEARWRLGLPAVEALICGEGERDAWTTACELVGPYPASLSWVERAWKIWPELSDEQVRNFVAGTEDSVTRASVKVARLGPKSSPATVEAVREEIESLPPGGEQLHLGLRFLEQRPCEPTREYEGQLASMAHHLAHIRYAASNDDLRRFLDLVAQAHEAKILRRQVENVLWAPESSAETLRHLARHAESAALLEELFEKTEEYAAMAAETSAEGFELRRQTLVTLTARLSARSKDRSFFDKARARLLPEETDDLAESTADALAEVGCAGLAGEIARNISSGPRRLRKLLEVRPPDLAWDELLSPAGLYEAVADPGPVTDELHSLSALLEAPETPESVERIAHEHLDEVNDPGRRIEALIDLAHHSMDYQEENTPKRLQDFPAAVLPLKQALGVVPSNDWLLGITPELVAVGARLGPAQAVAEVQEAWDRIMELEEVREDHREEALWSLLNRIPRLFSENGESGRVHRLLDWIESRLDDLRTGKERLAAKLRIVRNGEVLDPEPRDEAAWIESLGKDVAESSLHASDPRTIPLRRRLWRVDRSQALPILARATIRALGTAGMEGGENALRWFLNAYLAPDIGESGQEHRWRRNELRSALDRSKSIRSQDGAPTELPSLGETPDHGRLSQTERRILRSEKLQPLDSPWGRLRSGRGSALLLVVLFSSALLLVVDGEYWAWLTDQPRFGTTPTSTPLSGPALLLFAVCLAGLQSWAVRRFEWLVPSASGTAHLPRRVHDLLALIPFWGPGVLVASTRGKHGLGTRSCLNIRNRPPPRRWRGHRLVVNGWFQVALLLLGYLWLFMVLLWLLDQSSISDASRYVLLGVALSLHLLTALAFLVLLHARRRQLRSTSGFVYLLPLAFLLPILPLFLLFAWLFLADPRESALCARLRVQRRERWSAWSRFRARALMAWRHLPWWKRWRGGASKKRMEAGRLTKQWRLAERIKTCFVFLDAAAFAWAALWLGSRGWWSVVQASELLELMQIVAWVIVSLAAVALVVFWVREILGASVHCFGVHGTIVSSFLLGSSWGFLAGLVLGQAIYEHDVETMAGVLAFTGAVGAFLFFGVEVVGWFVSVPQRADASQYRHLRNVLFVVLAMYGMGLAGPPEGATSVPQLPREIQVGFLKIFVFWSPVLSAMLGGTLVRTLIPGRWKRRLRRGILLTAFAPLGGLAVPLWLIWRAREKRGTRRTAPRDPASHFDNTPSKRRSAP